jgi:hypothetical protein
MKMNKSSTNCKEKNCLKKLLDANDIDELSQQKKKKKPVLPTRDTHTKNLCERKKEKTNKQC